MLDVLRRRRLVDELVEAYVDWRETCARVDDAYRFWASEPGSRGGVGFGLYVAALDAEQRAAEVYAALVRRADKLSWSEDPAARTARRASARSRLAMTAAGTVISPLPTLMGGRARRRPFTATGPWPIGAGSCCATPSHRACTVCASCCATRGSTST